MVENYLRISRKLSHYYIELFCKISFSLLSLCLSITIQLTNELTLFLDIIIIKSLCNIYFSDEKSNPKGNYFFLKVHVNLNLTGFVFNFQVAILVYNRLKKEGVTIHWHGLLHKGTPWMDGASMISQCPIMPGQVFEYR